MGRACLGLGVTDVKTGPREALAAPLHPFPDISLDVDTGRTGKLKRSPGDKVTVSRFSPSLPPDGTVDAHTQGWWVPGAAVANNAGDPFGDLPKGRGWVSLAPCDRYAV